MKLSLNYIIIFCISAVYVSCAPLRKINIQTSVPPKLQISPEVRSVVILNRSFTPRFRNYDIDSLEKLYTRNPNGFSRTMLDSSAVDSAIVSMARSIYESQRFDVVVPVFRNIARNEKGGYLPPLDSGYIKDLCDEYDVDAVLVLESFKESIGRHASLDFTTVFQVLELEYSLEWKLYQPMQKPQAVSISAYDVLQWVYKENKLSKKFPKLPLFKDALIVGAFIAGEESAKKICPLWINARRYYYITKDSIIDSAVSLIKENRWEEAAEIWEKSLSAPSITKRSRVQYNLALASEMTGNLEKAIEWAEKSILTKASFRNRHYLHFLKKKQKNDKKEALKKMSS